MASLAFTSLSTIHQFCVDSGARFSFSIKKTEGDYKVLASGIDVPVTTGGLATSYNGVTITSLLENNYKLQEGKLDISVSTTDLISAFITDYILEVTI